MDRLALGQILLLSAIWGASFLLIRIAGTSFPPLWIALLRSGLGAALLWAVLLLRKRSLPGREHLPWLLVVGLFNNALPFICFAWGEQVVPSNIAAVLNATTPIFTMLLAAATARAWPARRVLLGVVTGFAGVVLVVRQGVSGAQQSVPYAVFLRGVAVITAGALGYAIASVVAKRKLSRVEPLSIAACQLGSAFLMVAPLALLGTRPVHVRVATLLAAASLGLLGSGVAYLLFFHILRTRSATQATAVTYLLPVWGIGWGLAAHEPVGAATVLGVAVTIAGLVTINLPARKALQTTSGNP